MQATTKIIAYHAAPCPSCSVPMRLEQRTEVYARTPMRTVLTPPFNITHWHYCGNSKCRIFGKPIMLDRLASPRQATP